MKLRNDLPLPSNAYLLLQMEKSYELGQMSDELAQALYTIAYRLIHRPTYEHLVYKDEMLGDAMMNLCRYWIKFNPQLSNNPFSYFTTMVYSSMLHVHRVEQHERHEIDHTTVDLTPLLETLSGFPVQLNEASGGN